MSVSSTGFQAFIQKHSYHNSPNSKEFIDSHLRQIPSQGGGAAEENVQDFLQTTSDVHQAYHEIYTPGGNTESNQQSYKNHETELKRLMKEQPGSENLADRILDNPLTLITKPIVEGDYMAFGVNELGENSFIGRHTGLVFLDVTRGEDGVQKFFQANPYE